jgi:hypothetical protein
MAAVAENLERGIAASREEATTNGEANSRARCAAGDSKREPGGQKKRRRGERETLFPSSLAGTPLRRKKPRRGSAGMAL